MTGYTDAEYRYLLEQHARLLRASAVSPAVAEKRGYRSAASLAELKRLGFGEAQRRLPALVTPVWTVHGEVAIYQLRPDEPRIVKGKAVKYETPAGGRIVLDVHPDARAKLADPTVPLWITEGVRKGDAAVTAGLCCVALLGVWNWRGTNGLGGTTALPDWEAVALKGRDVYVAYDSDVVLKPAVHGALDRLGAFLTSRGAEVRYVYLPSGEGGAKVGLDDFLAAGHGADDLLALASAELRLPPDDGVGRDSPYAAKPDGLVWNKPVQGGTVEVPLATFSARIVADVVEDDGAEERRVYRLEVALRNRTLPVDVPAAQFAGMGWVADRLGAGASIWPGMGTRDHARFAIQALSGEVPEHRVFVHTGWREVGGAWVYLHANGAVGPEGAVPGVSVALRGPLARFCLPEPPDGDDLVAAVRAALGLLDLLPVEVAVPLLGAAWLAPLRELLGDEAPDFVVWLHGRSGTFKSEILALAQALFGDFSRLNLPANFLITPNALERLAFEAKDALLAVDDYHPAGDPKEAQAMAQVANRLLRGAGNAAGRTRMRADTSLRPAFPPRCVAAASGERLPDGHSTVARMFPVPVAPGAIDPDNLAAAQGDRHLLPSATAGYLKHLAARFGNLRTELPARFRALRREAQGAGGHRREPGQIAHLLLGLEAFLGFAVEVGALSTTDRDARLQEARRVLLAHAREHGEAQREEAPERLFLRLLEDGFAAKRAYLEGKQGGAPDGAEQWGWEVSPRTGIDGIGREEPRHLPAGQLVGVLDDGWLLLFPEAAYQFAAEAVRRSGRVFPVELTTLVRRLAEAGLISVETEGGQRRLRVNAWVGGATRRVLKLRRDALESPSSCEDREGREGGEGGDPGEGGSGTNLLPTGLPDPFGEQPGRVDHQMLNKPACLPALPGLPGVGRRELPPVGEEVVEWSA